MSEDIRVNLQHEGIGSTAYATNIICQLDKMPAAEAATYQGADPHFTYNVFTTLLPLNNPQFVLFRDLMIDQVVIDIVTSLPRQWRIIDEPNVDIIDGHWQWVAVRMRGR